MNRRQARYEALARAWMLIDGQRQVGWDEDDLRPYDEVEKIDRELRRIVDRLADQWFALRPENVDGPANQGDDG